MTETYSLSADFANNILTSQLQLEIINEPGITTTLLRIDVSGDVVDIVFLSTISPGEKTILDTLITDHIPKHNSSNIVKIQEENVSTGGNFQATIIKVNALQNTTSTASISWPIPISALSMSFVTSTDHKGDIVNASVAKDTVFGVLTSDLTAKNAWISQNYVVNDEVRYNSKNYNCILNTVSNEDPTNSTYWELQNVVLNLSNPIGNIFVGYYINLYDGVNTNDLGRVLSRNVKNKTLTMEYANSDTFLSVTPTYARCTVYYLKDLEIGDPWNHVIGESKIGGSYIPPNTTITVEYENKSLTTDKTIIGIIEYLY